MIAAIEGEVFKKEPTTVFIKCYGVVYELGVSLNCSSKITTKNAFLYTKEIIRDDSRELFGFISREERELFVRLTKISGVGAKTAIAILSTFTPEQFYSTISQKEQKSLQRVPGIGAKSAGRILVELEGFVPDSATAVDSSKQEALIALEGLGFKRDEVSKMLQGIEATDTADIIKEALRKIKR